MCSLIAFSCARTDPSTPVGKNGITSPSTIHQEVLINVPRQRVYEALTNPAVFAGFTGRTVKELNADVGGSFELFDGIILGRQIELIPGQRVIQAWREKDWPVGAYTIVQFELSDSGNATKLVFDQSGIAPENVEHLSIGWKENYWDPMAKYLEKK
ncbi:MAG TPA: SRPBCC domain-containing protein [Pyrinomonadaceae bacterium]